MLIVLVVVTPQLPHDDNTRIDTHVDNGVHDNVDDNFATVADGDDDGVAVSVFAAADVIHGDDIDDNDLDNNEDVDDDDDDNYITISTTILSTVTVVI